MPSSRMPFTRRPAIALAAVLAAPLLALTGCSGSDDRATGGSPSASSPVGAATVGSSTQQSPGGSVTVDPTPAPSPTDLPVIATKSAHDGDTPLQVSLNEVRASGRLMTVTWSVRNDGQNPWTVGGFFWSAIFHKAFGDPLPTEVNGNVDGVYVLDAVSARRYLPARDKAGNCVCTSPTNGLMVAPGTQAALQAVFQAPPAQVATVDVVLPHVGTYAAVPVTRT